MAGLDYYRARYYDPTTGRFLSKDPSGMVDGPNLYAYAGNNPVNFADPSGHCIASPTISCGSQHYSPSGFYCPSCTAAPPSPSSPSAGSGPAAICTTPDCGAPLSGDPGAWASKCWFRWSLFFVGLVASLLGFYFGPAQLSGMAASFVQATTAGTGMAVGLAGIGAAFMANNIASAIAGIIRFIWNYLVLIMFQIIAPALGWFGAVEVGFGAASVATPVTAGARAAAVAINIGMGLVGLGASGCLVPA